MPSDAWNQWRMGFDTGALDDDVLIDEDCLVTYHNTGDCPAVDETFTTVERIEAQEEYNLPPCEGCVVGDPPKYGDAQ